MGRPSGRRNSCPQLLYLSGAACSSCLILSSQANSSSFKGFVIYKDAVGLFGLDLFQDQRGLAALPPVGKSVIDLGWVDLGQCLLAGALHGLADRNGAPPIGGVKVDVLRLKAENFTFPQRKDHT